MKDTKDIDVVIFCGGRGTRLMEKTSTVPKPLVNIGNKPIVWHIMKIYSSYGINRFILTLGYKGHMLRKMFEKEKNILCLNTGVNSNTQRRLKLCEKHIKSNLFMVTYGDGVGTINIDRLLATHKRLRKKYGILGTITVTKPTSPFGVIDVENELAKVFREKPKMKDFVNIGFMVFEREVFNFMDNSNTFFERDLLTKLACQRKIGVYYHTGFWKCMDTYRDYVELNKIWRREKIWKVW